jgi:hypothetical protein
MDALLERELMGYPDTTVALYVEAGNVHVIVHDNFGDKMLRPKDGKEALDMYHHPFAYGYTAPDLGDYE